MIRYPQTSLSGPIAAPDSSHLLTGIVGFNVLPQVPDWYLPEPLRGKPDLGLGLLWCMLAERGVTPFSRTLVTPWIVGELMGAYMPLRLDDIFQVKEAASVGGLARDANGRATIAYDTGLLPPTYAKPHERAMFLQQLELKGSLQYTGYTPSSTLYFRHLMRAIERGDILLPAEQQKYVDNAPQGQRHSRIFEILAPELAKGPNGNVRKGVKHLNPKDITPYFSDSEMDYVRPKKKNAYSLKQHRGEDSIADAIGYLADTEPETPVFVFYEDKGLRGTIIARLNGYRSLGLESWYPRYFDPGHKDFDPEVLNGITQPVHFVSTQGMLRALMIVCHICNFGRPENEQVHLFSPDELRSFHDDFSHILETAAQNGMKRYNYGVLRDSAIQHPTPSKGDDPMPDINPAQFHAGKYRFPEHSAPFLQHLLPQRQIIAEVMAEWQQMIRLKVMIEEAYNEERSRQRRQVHRVDELDPEQALETAMRNLDMVVVESRGNQADTPGNLLRA